MRYLAIIFLALWHVHSVAQCNNDNTFDGTFSLTSEGDSDTKSCVRGGRYYTVDVVTGETYEFSTCGGDWDTLITLYSDSNGSLIAFNDDYCGWQSFISWNATFTGTVRVLIDEWDCTGYNSCGANLTLTWVSSSGSGNNNDICQNAIAVSCGDFVSGTTTGASTESLANCGTSISAPAVWYLFIGTGEEVTFSMCNGTSYNSKISVFSGTCNALICEGGSSSGCGDDGYVTLLTSAGIEYFILAHGNSSQSGNFNLEITCVTSTPDGNKDCGGSITLCSDDTFDGNNGDYGNTQDLNATNQGCLNGENQSSWYVFSPVSEGTIGFTLEPSNGIDYDFAIWGPFASDDVPCPPNETPLRCSYSGVYGNTGLTVGAGDESEPPSGDAWVEAITVSSDDLNKYYVMLIDNYTADNTSYTFHWDLSGVSLNCAILLPIELLSFTGKVASDRNELLWITATELNNSHFDIERSTDIENFESIGMVTGAGTSATQSSYIFNDSNRPFGTTYYRLKQTDFNGEYSYSDIISLTHNSELDLIAVFPNPGKGRFTCELKAAKEMMIELTAFDLQGRAVMSDVWDIDAGSSTNIIDLSEVSSGNYILQFESNGIILNRQQLIKR
ncbi:MAG: T9SS type A sorting domain-containing protein [Cryomorphaceae bacterium]|nr:T9SS type A sorting domain-containing protein [Cryomorphaceae bacterium]